MLELDGRDGGGQLVRTAVSMSALTGRAVRMRNVRGDRPSPGLKAQHVAAIEAVGSVTEGETAGVDAGSETFSFDPGRVRGGETRVEIPTAGSATLVCDALAPLALALDDTLRVTVIGGTDVRWSPPADYLRYVKLPLLRDVGLDAHLTVERRGFYPAGGGRLTLSLRPSSARPLTLRTPGALRRLSVHAVASTTLQSANVADRMATAVHERVGGVAKTRTRVTYAEANSPGAVVTLVADCGASRAGFDALGRRGVPAERVGDDAAEAFVAWRETGAPADEFLGDQLLVWVALAGGAVRIPRVTDHVRTNVEVIRAFGYDIEVRRENGDGVVVTAPPPDA
ncbi:RNA 3'-terminal phosphate cyclase [Halogeometricum limi]|uniref:RNA 3'-terminal phosphate cyclase n=1 Tax=Halogeometricum limi TaxID=555875 RepID=A0A1I6FYU6_9EURY|nr:RNA 3'-terminal phosphate cyclase [Halogeometricum limi]SFR35113.1 RNA 3'-terminal phosphate cyclase (ATP) [Halogeometricum limi]